MSRLMLLMVIVAAVVSARSCSPAKASPRPVPGKCIFVTARYGHVGGRVCR